MQQTSVDATKLQELYLSLDDLIAKAWNAHFRGQRSEPKSLYKQATRIASSAGRQAEVSYLQGLINVSVFDIIAAERHFTEAIQADEESGNSYRLAVHLSGRGWARSWGKQSMVGLDDLDSAVELLKAIELDGCQFDASGLKLEIPLKWILHFLWWAYHRRGYIFGEQSRHSWAIHSYQAAASYSKQATKMDLPYKCYSMTLSNLGCVFCELGQYETAIEYFKDAIAEDVDDCTYHNNLGFLYFVIRKDEMALEALEQGYKIAERLGANRAYICYNLGLCYLRTANSAQQKDEKIDNFKEARKYFSTAYQDHRREDDLLRALPADYLAQRLKEKISDLERYERAVSCEDRECIIASDVLEELLGDLDNFVTEGAGRLDTFDSFLNKPGTITDHDCKLVVLRRWNSFTPGIPLPINGSNKGGGYFLCCGGLGVVIDPGFQFVENFAEAGLSLEDIDAIILTHAHIDHTNDLERLIMLLAERNSRGLTSRRIALGLNLGCLNRLNVGWILRESTVIGTVHTLTPGQSIVLSDRLTIDVLKAKHADVASEETAVGLRVNMKDGSEVYKIAFSSDTAWTSRIAQQYRNSDMVVLHLGSTNFGELASLARYIPSRQAVKDLFEDPKFNLKWHEPYIKGILGYEDIEDFKERLTRALFDRASLRSRSHLTFLGVYDTILQLKPPPKLIILSEFGEELGSTRHKMAKVLNNHFARGTVGPQFKEVRCLTGDIGLEICVSHGCPTIKCEYCGDYVDYRNIVEECSRWERLAIKHYCKEHRGEKGESPFRRVEFS